MAALGEMEQAVDKEKITRLETLFRRNLSVEDEERPRRIKETLGIKNNDGLWGVLIATKFIWVPAQ